jgi:hypothetical protein
MVIFVNMNFASLLFLLGVSAATPVVVPSPQGVDTCIVQMYSGDLCTGQEDSYTLAGDNASGCMNVPSPKRSYLALGR